MSVWRNDNLGSISVAWLIGEWDLVVLIGVEWADDHLAGPVVSKLVVSFERGTSPWNID